VAFSRAREFLERTAGRLVRRTVTSATRQERGVEREASGEETAMITVWIYINTNVPVGDHEHVKVFADQDAAGNWFEQHDREGVAFEYPVIGELFERMIRKQSP
jgi:hypothetical protein